MIPNLMCINDVLDRGGGGGGERRQRSSSLGDLSGLTSADLVSYFR